MVVVVNKMLRRYFASASVRTFWNKSADSRPVYDKSGERKEKKEEDRVKEV